MSREILNILKEAKKQGVKLIVKEGSLTVNSSTSIDPNLVTKIKEYKACLLYTSDAADD